MMSSLPHHLIAAALTLLVAASGAEAALTTEKCLAQKTRALNVGFVDGAPNASLKNQGGYVRAVRGGW